MVAAALGNHRESHRNFDEASQIADQTRQNLSLILPERQLLAYMKQTQLTVLWVPAGTSCASPMPR